MEKKVFENTVMEPLSREFGIIILFNGQEARDKGLSLRGALGRSYTSRKNKPCVITWHRNISDTFHTLFHEIGHSILHGKGSGFQCGRSFKEIEAESVAKTACTLLGIPYRRGFKRMPEVDYIEYYKKRYLDNCRDFKIEPKSPRYDKVHMVAERIADILKRENGGQIEWK